MLHWLEWVGSAWQASLLCVKHLGKLMMEQTELIKVDRTDEADRVPGVRRGDGAGEMQSHLQKRSLPRPRGL